MTLVPGRGTEESKTNDVTGRIKRGEIGLCIELDRPGLGCSFKDISLMIFRFGELGLELEPNNPLTTSRDNGKGGFSKAVLAQRILSAIIEVKLADDRLEEISDHQQSWGYEDGPWKGPGPPLLVAADYYPADVRDTSKPL
ncbi:MAG: hypothetical protein GY775_04170, partial [Candidatus Scalindua sp.]|nr:hypothetical protein [Candidatus Scalindua sp.]